MTQKVKACLGVAALVLIIVIAVAAHSTLAGRVSPPAHIVLPEDDAVTRQRAPDFALTDSDGNALRFSDIIAEGKPVVLNFWASWCPSCRMETPGFDRVYRDRGDEVRFVMLNLTDGVRETVQSGQRYIQEGGFVLPVYFDTLQEGLITYGIRFIPVTLFIDREGYVITSMQGAVDEVTLRTIIDFMVQ
ncbi:MAG: TlpA family protein disulfide reductase [Treponema sp.]|nr:TlpA family protein disulfide reductase [Treponema sp.]